MAEPPAPRRRAHLLLVARRHRGVLATLDARVAAWAGAGRDVAVIPV